MKENIDKDVQTAKFSAYLRNPITLLFFAFLALFVIVDLIMPDRETSSLENRSLTQNPVFETAAISSASGLGEKYGAFSDEWKRWAQEYDSYTKDQLLFRDEWVGLQSAFESAQGKLENGGVWFAHDGYLIAKNDVLTTLQQNSLPVNTTAVCELAERHEGRVTTMIIPSPANILSGELRASPPQIDEDGLLDDINAQFAAAGANVVDLREAFDGYTADGQQLYYRTDHHWTTPGGARLAYETLCGSLGREAVLPPEDLLTEVPDFLGTNYSKSRHFGTQPEPLYYYDFSNELTVYKLQSDDTILEEPGPLMDKTRFEECDKYAAFLRGNNGYSVLEGNGEGSILVIKDSYGNSFVPYLIESYETIGIIDLRAWFSVDGVIEEGGYDDILVLYSFDSFSSDAYARRMATSMQE